MAKLARVLVIEDEPMVRSALVHKLNSVGFEVIEAGDGQEGLDLAQKEKPDLVLLDLILPLMDGLSVLERIRSESWGKDMPVIILSNLSDVNTVEESKKRGVYDYLVKTDWTLDDVIAKSKQVLSIK